MIVGFLHSLLHFIFDCIKYHTHSYCPDVSIPHILSTSKILHLTSPPNISNYQAVVSLPGLGDDAPCFATRGLCLFAGGPGAAHHRGRGGRLGGTADGAPGDARGRKAGAAAELHTVLVEMGLEFGRRRGIEVGSFGGRGGGAWNSVFWRSTSKVLSVLFFLFQVSLLLQLIQYTLYYTYNIYLYFLDSCQGLMEKMLEGMGYFDQSRGDSHGFLGIAVTSRCFGRLATHPTRTHPAPALRAGPASHSPERGFLGCLVGGTKETWIWRWFDHWNLSISHHCGYQHCCYRIGMAASFVGTRSKCPGTRKEWWRLFGCLHPRGTSFEDTFVYSTTLFRRHPGGWLHGESWQFVVTRFLQVGTWRHLMGLSQRLSSWAFLREGAFLPNIQTWYSIATLSLQQAFWICQVFAFWIGCTFLSWCSVGHGTTPEFHGETADITMASGKSNRWLVRGLFLHIDASQSCQIDFRLGRKVGHWGICIF